MKRFIHTIALTLLVALLSGCAAGATETGGQTVSLFAASVGKGDALLVRVDDYVCLIDTGKAYAMGKVRAAMAHMGVEALDAVFITHCDDDHTGGLDWLARGNIPVGAWYASGLFMEVKPDKHPAVKAAALRGGEVTWLTRGDAVPLGDTGAVFRVLAPSVLFEDKDDNNSLVMMLETDQGRMLFPGDMELPQEAVLLGEGDDIACAVLKAPNHGDDDTLSAEFARAAGAQIAVISTDSYEKPGTPDPGVVSRLQAAGSAVWVTQDAELGILVTLADGAASAARVNTDAPVARDVALRAVSPEEDTVTLANAGAAIDLTGWYLYSDRGDEIFAFPDGFVLEAGRALVIGSRSAEGVAVDLLWDDKKVVHKSKTDVITLYDAWGRPVDSLSNGY